MTNFAGLNGYGGVWSSSSRFPGRLADGVGGHAAIDPSPTLRIHFPRAKLLVLDSAWTRIGSSETSERTP